MVSVIVGLSVLLVVAVAAALYFLHDSDLNEKYLYESWDREGELKETNWNLKAALEATRSRAAEAESALVRKCEDLKQARDELDRMNERALKAEQLVEEMGEIGDGLCDENDGMAAENDLLADLVVGLANRMEAIRDGLDADLDILMEILDADSDEDDDEEDEDGDEQEDDNRPSVVPFPAAETESSCSGDACDCPA